MDEVYKKALERVEIFEKELARIKRATGGRKNSRRQT